MFILIAAIFGFALGANVDANMLINNILPPIMGVWIGIWLLSFVTSIVSEALSEVYSGNWTKDDTLLGDTDEIVIIAVKRGEVVGEMRTWGPSLAEGKRKFWAKKLPRLFTRRAREVAPSEQ
jgi:hypothetical protein